MSLGTDYAEALFRSVGELRKEHVAHLGGQAPIGDDEGGNG